MLVIDPIDGTRPAVAGFEQCVVSVALARYTPNVTLGDVRFGCIAELKLDDIFFAERGRGAVWYGADGQVKPAQPLPITDMRRAPISFEVAARPFEYLGLMLGDVVDSASLTGGCFLFNSTAYSLTRLMTGQLAACLDVGNRMMRDVPATVPRFLELGAGKVIGLFTYDIAAAALIASEAGAVVTDAYGRDFTGTPLLDTSRENVQSICAASTAELHAALIAAIDAGSARLAASVARGSVGEAA